MTTIKNKKILNIVLIFSVLALSAAYFIQYVMGHQPCNLCLVERIPYFVPSFNISNFYIVFFSYFYIIFYFWCYRIFLSFWY